MTAPDPTRPPTSDRRGADRRRYSAVIVPALLLSIGLHFLALKLISFSTPVDGDGEPPPTPLIRIVPAMQAYDIQLVQTDVPAPQVQVRRLEEQRTAEIPTVTITAPPATVTAAPPVRVDPDDPSLARLRYRSTPKTEDVWRRSEPPGRTPDEIVRERVALQLSAYNDSVAAEAAAAARATDWTVKDANGGRWGVTPGAIHLGAVTLPLPFTFSAPPEKRQEVAGRLANWQAIQQQATYVEGREVTKDRVKAIEQRKAAERAARLKANGSSGGGTSSTSGGGAGGSTGGSTGSAGGTSGSGGGAGTRPPGGS